MTRVDLDAWKRAADWVRNCDIPEMRVVTADPEEVDALVAELRAAREDYDELRRLVSRYGQHEFEDDCPQPDNPDFCLLCHAMALDNRRQARDEKVAGPPAGDPP